MPSVRLAEDGDADRAAEISKNGGLQLELLNLDVGSSETRKKYFAGHAAFAKRSWLIDVICLSGFSKILQSKISKDT